MRLIYLLLLGLVVTSAHAQGLIKGYVFDAETETALERASIYNRSGNAGTFTDADGRFELRCAINDTILVTAIGYEPRVVVISADNPSIQLPMNQMMTVLDEVVVKRKKYSRKNNPAVELAKGILRHRDARRLENCDFYQRSKYRRIAFGLNDFDSREDNHILNQFPFLNKFADTISVNGVVKPVLPVSVDESMIQERWSSEPSYRHAQTIWNDHAGLDDAFDSDGIKSYLESIIGHMDIFQNDVQCMNYRFVSPISNTGILFYKYYLGDTIMVDNEKCVQLIFVPQNTQDLGFMGSLYVTCDSTFFVKSVDLSFPRNINLNFIGSLTLRQTYKRTPGIWRAINSEEAIVEFSIFKKAQNLFAQVNTSYNDYIFNPDDTLMVQQVTKMDSQGLKNTQDMSQMVSSLRKDKKYFWSEFAITSLAQDFLPTATTPSRSLFDIGPLSSIFSSNGLEGFRMTIGGQTTTAMSRNLQLGGYAAWGFVDHQFKYGLRAEYSFVPKESFFNERLINSLTLTHSYDTYLLGNSCMFSSAETSLIPVMRKPDDQCIYQRFTSLSYKREWNSHLISSVMVLRNSFLPSRLVSFWNDQGETFEHYNSVGFQFSLRYALNEKYMVTRKQRVQLNSDALVLMLNHTYAPRGLMGNEMTSNKTELGLQKRFWLSSWGFADVIVKAEKQWNRVHYMDLVMPYVNITYNILPESFALLNVMEFVNDQQLSWFLKCRMNGILLNRIPLVKRLKMREVFYFSGVWGSLSHKNDPSLNPDLMCFPTTGTSLTTMGRKPYMEIGVGVDNLLHIISLQYIWRLTYRDNPGVDKSGLRFQVSFSF